MHDQTNSPRPRGTTSLLHRRPWGGGKARQDKLTEGRQAPPSPGDPGERTGAGQPAADSEHNRSRPVTERRPTGPAGAVDVAAAGAHYIDHRKMLGRKRCTLMDYESMLRVHLVPFFGGRTLDEIDVPLLEAFIYAKQDEGKAPKSIVNYLRLLGGILNHGVKRGWCSQNPVAAVDKPRASRDQDIRFLTLDELEAILAATPDDERGRTERILYLTAAMTGMRRGELVALRWQDVDQHARQIRVRRNFVRGEFGTPKSRRSSRAVPLAPRLAAELREHHEWSRFRDDLDLVFAHPATGRVLDPYKLSKRVRAAARRAGVRPVRLHDLRHTFGTQMAAAGAPLRAIQEWMGHSDYRTTSIYADYALDPNQGARYAERAFGEPSTKCSQRG